MQKNTYRHSSNYCSKEMYQAFFVKYSIVFRMCCSAMTLKEGVASILTTEEQLLSVDVKTFTEVKL